MHRFALNGSLEAIGGMEYATPCAATDSRRRARSPAARQRAALHQLLAALTPVRARDPGHGAHAHGDRARCAYDADTVELFGSRTRPAFDELGAARTLAQMIVDGILQRDRAARLVAVRDARARIALTLGETIDSLVAATWTRDARDAPKHAALRRVAQRAPSLDRCSRSPPTHSAAPEVRAVDRPQDREPAPRGAPAKRRQRIGR